MDNNPSREISAAEQPEQATKTAEQSQVLFPTSVFVFGVFRPGDDTFRIGSERLFGLFRKERAVIRGAKLYFSQDVALLPAIEFVDDQTQLVHGVVCSGSAEAAAAVGAEVTETTAATQVAVAVQALEQIFGNWSIFPSRETRDVIRVADGKTISAYCLALSPRQLASLGESLDDSGALVAGPPLIPLSSGSWLTRPLATMWICHNCTDNNEAWPEVGGGTASDTDAPCVCETCGAPMQIALSATRSLGGRRAGVGAFAADAIPTSDLGMHASTTLSAIAELSGAAPDVVAALLSTIGPQAARFVRGGMDTSVGTSPRRLEGAQKTCFAYDPRMLLHKTMNTDALGHPLLPQKAASAGAGEAGAGAAAVSAGAAAADAPEVGPTRTPLQLEVVRVKALEAAAMARRAATKAMKRTSMHPERPTRLLAIVSHLAREGILQKCSRVSSRYCTDAEILAVHTEGHLALVRHVIAKTGGSDADGFGTGMVPSSRAGGGGGGGDDVEPENAGGATDPDASAADGETEADGAHEASGRRKRGRRDRGAGSSNASDESALVGGFGDAEPPAADDYDDTSGGGGGGVGGGGGARCPTASMPAPNARLSSDQAPAAKRVRLDAACGLSAEEGGGGGLSKERRRAAMLSSGAEGDGDESAAESASQQQQQQLGRATSAAHPTARIGGTVAGSHVDRAAVLRGGLESGAEGDESAAEFVTSRPPSRAANAATSNDHPAASPGVAAAQAELPAAADTEAAGAEKADGAGANSDESGSDDFSPGNSEEGSDEEVDSDGEQPRYGAEWKDVYKGPDTLKAARLSAGTVCAVTEAVLQGNAANGLALVRPPGHHAECSCAMGFCVLNNVAIAAKMALNKYGLKRVLIMDWDVHHGNGTQKAFYDDERVLYISTHRYPFYPGTGNYQEVGKGRGAGFNANICWPHSGMNDADYMNAFNMVVMPLAHAFQPELVIISAGFDAADGDPLGQMRVSPRGYAHMTSMLKSVAVGKLVLALEGGYNLKSISHSIAACANVMVGGVPESGGSEQQAHPRAIDSILQTIEALAPHWTHFASWLRGMQRFRREEEEVEVEDDEEEGAHGGMAGLGDGEEIMVAGMEEELSEEGEEQQAAEEEGQQQQQQQQQQQPSPLRGDAEAEDEAPRAPDGQASVPFITEEDGRVETVERV